MKNLKRITYCLQTKPGIGAVGQNSGMTTTTMDEITRPKGTHSAVMGVGANWAAEEAARPVNPIKVGNDSRGSPRPQGHGGEFLLAINGTLFDGDIKMMIEAKANHGPVRGLLQARDEGRVARGVMNESADIEAPIGSWDCLSPVAFETMVKGMLNRNATRISERYRLAARDTGENYKHSPHCFNSATGFGEEDTRDHQRFFSQSAACIAYRQRVQAVFAERAAREGPAFHAHSRYVA